MKDSHTYIQKNTKAVCTCTCTWIKKYTSLIIYDSFRKKTNKKTKKQTQRSLISETDSKQKKTNVRTTERLGGRKPQTWTYPYVSWLWQVTGCTYSCSLLIAATLITLQNGICHLNKVYVTPLHITVTVIDFQ